MVVLIHSLISVCYSVITKYKYVNTLFVGSVECIFLENIQQNKTTGKLFHFIGLKTL
jgi:hypothetical protein